MSLFLVSFQFPWLRQSGLHTPTSSSNWGTGWLTSKVPLKHDPAVWIFTENAKTKFGKMLKLQDQASFIELWVTSHSVCQLCFKKTVTIQILDIAKHGNDLFLVFKENQTTICCLFNQLSQGRKISSWVYKALLLFIRKFPCISSPS